jgi:hypothetical protein
MKFNKHINIFFILLILNSASQGYSKDANSILKILWQQEIDSDANTAYSLGAVAFNEGVVQYLSVCF